MLAPDPPGDLAIAVAKDVEEQDIEEEVEEKEEEVERLQSEVTASFQMRPDISHDPRRRAWNWCYDACLLSCGWPISAALLAVAVATFAVISAAAARDEGRKFSVDAGRLQALLLGFSQLVAAVAGSWLLGALRSFDMRRVAGFALLNWASSWACSLQHALECWPSALGVTSEADPISLFFTLLAVVLEAACIVGLLSVCIRRIEVLESAIPLHVSPHLRRLRYAVGFSMALVLALSGLPGFVHGHWPIELVGCLAWWCIAMLVSFFSLALRAFNVSRKLAADAARCAFGRLASEGEVAAKAARDQMRGVAIGGASTLCRFIASLTAGGALWPLPALEEVAMNDAFAWALSVTLTIFACLDIACNCLAALWLSGAFVGALHVAKMNRAKEMARALTWQGAARRWRPHENPSWHAKVCDLAMRGFTLEALLRFYHGLGTDYMEHWDPRRHTTADVVRHAIIPQSATARSALAPLMMAHEPTRPRKMVTHTWGTAFRDLVAAVCADALGEDEYGRIAYLLEHDPKQIEAWLEAGHKMKQTYWVCAFSVNQHCTICGENHHGGTDSVTGELYPLCDCGLPKKSSSMEPITPSGRSIDCEVNKFECMMKLLSAFDPDFEQVVAIDTEFKLFGRAWCVAELAAANAMGMKQCLKLRSAGSFERNEPQLRGLRIENMEASRLEDKEEILRSIPDKAAFDANLQRLLFQDLLLAWHRLDAMEQMHRLAQIDRWQQVCAGHGWYHLWKTGVTTADEGQTCDSPLEPGPIDSALSHVARCTA
mmetsp:Transcript_75976/g.210995  ORF Transcript_75976/g.210995 Transcript_75976/m.210995 type:complete len:773 (-) Transcript_75976:269-2587(-)